MFKEKYKDLQHIVRELFLLRKHNTSFKEGDSQEGDSQEGDSQEGDSQEGERFLRILPDVKATDKDSLHNLLERATSKNILVLKDKEHFLKKIVDFRNAILHGNFEQRAKENNLSSAEEYFKTLFASEIEKIFDIIDDLFKQIEPDTGGKR